MMNGIVSYLNYIYIICAFTGSSTGFNVVIVFDTELLTLTDIGDYPMLIWDPSCIVGKDMDNNDRIYCFGARNTTGSYTRFDSIYFSNSYNLSTTTTMTTTTTTQVPITTQSLSNNENSKQSDVSLNNWIKSSATLTTPAQALNVVYDASFDNRLIWLVGSFNCPKCVYY